MRAIGIIVLLGSMVIFPLFCENLLKNPGMEVNNSMPVEWRLDEFRRDGTVVTIEQGDAHSGNNYVSLENTVDNDSRLIQTVKVKENTHYKISGWIKTENVSDHGFGANLSLNEHWFLSREIKGTRNKWEYVEFYLSVTEDLTMVSVCLRLGGYGGTAIGKASFDDISMVEVDKVPGGDRTFTIGRTNKDESGNKKRKNMRREEERVVEPVTVKKPLVDPRVVISNIIVYSFIILSVGIFCIQLIIVKPVKQETEEE